MSISRPTLTDSSSPSTGDILNAAFFTDLYDRIDALVGNWTAIPFNAANFTGNGSMTWTVASGDVGLNRYQIINKTLFWTFILSTTTIGGTPNTSLQIAWPSGTPATASAVRLAYCSDNGTVREANAAPSGSVLQISRVDGSNWTASTNNTTLYFTGFYELS